MFGLHAFWAILGIKNVWFGTGGGMWVLSAGTMGYLLIIFLPFVLYRKHRILPAVLAELVIVAGLYAFVPVSEPAFGFLHIPVMLVSYMAWGWHALWAAVAVLILPLVLSDEWRSLPGDKFLDELVNSAILFGIGFCFQKMVLSYKKIKGMYKIIQGQNQTLEVYARQIEKLTLAEERNRLSRELHDTVGHVFTTTITGMDAVYLLIDLSPQEAKKNLKELLQVTRSGLDEVRRHIHAIADDRQPQTLVGHLTEVAGQFASHAGIDVNLDVRGEEYPVSERVRLTLIRCLQESLTNAKRHGNATAIRIALSFEGNRLVLVIADNGRGNANLVKGFGLTGMTERLSGVNGSLAIESSPEAGTTIRCTVPVHPGQAA
jgi:signal transduction histidine kinase